MRIASRWYLMLGATSALCMGPTGNAQNLRDPTIAPLSQADAGVATGSGIDDVTLAHLSVLRVGGQLQLLVGSRLHAVGDSLGRATLVRLTESEVWLRQGKVLKKLSLNAGVRPVSPKSPQE